MDDADGQRLEPILREATGSDLPVLVQLTRAFYDEDGFVASDDDIRIRVGDLLTDQDARIAVVEHNGTACAFALTTVRLILESGLVAEIQDLFVDPRHRREGIATALIEDAGTWARDRSASLLEVVVAPNGSDITRLVSYYKSRGFVDEARRILSRKL